MNGRVYCEYFVAENSPFCHYRIDCCRNPQLQRLVVVIPPRNNAPLQAIQFVWGQFTQALHHLLNILDHLNEHLGGSCVMLPLCRPPTQLDYPLAMNYKQNVSPPPVSLQHPKIPTTETVEACQKIPWYHFSILTVSGP